MNNNGAARAAAAAAAAIVSGEESHASDFHHDDEDDDDDNDVPRHVQPDELYGEHLDDEDEAWVYQNMRSGIAQEVSVSNNSNTKKKVKMLKPRNSDAVLSCPCCFTTVCMDCQRHERYQNQFRAMFVMNIGVDWNRQLIYSKKKNGLEVVLQTPSPPKTNVVMDDVVVKGKEEVYYSVHCINCQTEVAALDMDDEVYHFFGCMESA